MDQYIYAAELLKKYEKFTSPSKWDVNAYRIGYGSDTRTLPNGQFVKVKQGDTTTPELATKDLQRRIKEFEKKVIKRVQPEYWDPLNYQVKAALISLAYNYGNITKQAILNAIRKQDNKQIAEAVISSTYNDNPGALQKGLRIRRKKEADIILNAPPPEKKGSINLKLLLIIPLLFIAYQYLTKK